MNRFQASAIFIISLNFLGNFSSFSHAGGENGTDRGGGDDYVAEFQTIKRTVIASIDQWTKNGALTLSEADLKKFNDNVQTVKVFSLDHVYLDPNDLSTEISILNEPRKNPPQITLGRVRWDALKQKSSIVIEMMVLHELLSVLGIADSQFEKSYSVIVDAMVNLKTFKVELLSKLDEVNHLQTELYSTGFLTQINTFFETAFLDRDYEKCMNGHRRFCMPFFTKVSLAVDTFMDENMLKPFTEQQVPIQIKIDALYQWINKQPTQFSMWGKSLMSSYIDESNQIAHTAMKKLGDRQKLFDDQCTNHQDRIILITCFAKFSRETIPNQYPESFGPAQTETIQNLEKVKTQVDEQVDIFELWNQK